MKPLTKRQQQALATKQKIFKCAVSLFAQKAYENVTVNDICQQAQVSVGAFYHHYQSKENILEEGYHLFDQEVELAWFAGHPADNLDAIRFLISEQAASMERMGVLAALQYFKNQLSCSEKYILNPDRFFYQTIKNTIEKEISSGNLKGTAFLITEDILSATRGTIYDWCLHEGSYSLSEKMLRMTEMVLQYHFS